MLFGGFLVIVCTFTALIAVFFSVPTRSSAGATPDLSIFRFTFASVCLVLVAVGASWCFYFNRRAVKESFLVNQKLLPWRLLGPHLRQRCRLASRQLRRYSSSEVRRCW